MHSAHYAVARCSSVCPSHASIVSKRLHITWTFFYTSVSRSRHSLTLNVSEYRHNFNGILIWITLNSAVSFRTTEWLSKMFSGTKRRAIYLRQLSSCKPGNHKFPNYVRFSLVQVLEARSSPIYSLHVGAVFAIQQASSHTSNSV